MGRLFLLLMLLVASIGAAYVIMQGNPGATGARPYTPPKALRSGDTNAALHNMQEDKFAKAQREAFTEACVNEGRKNEEAKKSGMDIQGFCGCIADAHMKLDFSISGEKEKRTEYLKKGKPCFEKYLKPVIAKSCALARATSGIEIDCACMYGYSMKEHVTHWISGTEGKGENELSDQAREQRKLDTGMDILKKCIK